MKNSILTLIGVFTSILTFGQSEPEVLFENDSIKISKQIIRCQDVQEGLDQDQLLLSITNKTSTSFYFSFDPQLFYNDRTTPVALTSENHVSLSLSPNEYLSGKCNSEKLRYFTLDHNGWIKDKLTSLKLSNITITGLN